jgi:hypothetical protein
VGDLTGTVRKVVLYGVDEQPWEKTAEALRGGLKADGEVTLLLERPAEGSPFSTWTAVEDKRATQAREVRASCDGCLCLLTLSSRVSRRTYLEPPRRYHLPPQRGAAGSASHPSAGLGSSCPLARL